MTKRKRPAAGRSAHWKHRLGGAPTDAEGAQWLFGVHAALAAWANPERRCRRLLLASGGQAALGPRFAAAAPANARRPEPESVAAEAIADLLPPEAPHQGVALLADPLPDAAIEDVIARAGERAFVVVLDQPSDPRNVGAVMRSALAFGASALVLPDRRSAPMTPSLVKAASGAVERLPVSRVVNLARALGQLKEAGFWCIGLDPAGPTPLGEAVGDRRLALVLGAEGHGLRRLTAEHCDLLARIPMQAGATSLNLAAAAAIACYEAASRRDRPALPVPPTAR